MFTQFASTMLLLTGAGIIGLGVRWRRLGAPAWLTLNREELLDLLAAVRTGVVDLCNDTVDGWDELLDRLSDWRKQALNWLVTVTVPIKPLVLTTDTPPADRDFPGSETPTVRIQITRPHQPSQPKTIEVRAAMAGHYRHLAGRPGTVLFDDLRLRALGEIAAGTERVKAAIDRTVITNRVVTSVFYDRLEKVSRTPEILDA